ncbi:FAD-dependent oxidoreductase [Chloroflexota bacterium]
MSPGAGKPEEIKAELVIVGGGGAGLAAATAAAESGLKGIVVLEKRGSLGGNTARATGLFACESPTQARNKIIADKDDLFKRAMQWAHWSRVNPRIFRAFLNKSGDTIRWLEDKGLEFQVIAFFANQDPRVEHVATGKGAQVTATLADTCRELGVQLLLNSSGRKLLRDAKGNVTGITAINETGEELEITARSVIITTGGFGGNTELLKKYCPLYYEGMPLRGFAFTGDGLLMAEEAGAAIDDFVTMIKEGPRIELNSWPVRGLERDPCTLWVNKRGERFVDESIGAHPFEGVNAIIRQPEKICYSIIDTSIMKKMEEKIPALEKNLQIEAGKDRIKISGSWDEIARWIGADPAILKATIDEYNTFCERGYDAVFAKDRRNLMPLTAAPFYAMKGMPTLLDTIGGIRINEHMEVLDKEEKTIPGFYAAGVATGGWESEAYCSDLSGSAFGYAINSGRIAGENAAEYLQGLKKK